MVFVLSSGSDPLQSLQRFASEVGKDLIAISLGQRQEEIARRAILEAKNLGQWVLLQNCHLSRSFMPELENIIEKFAECRILNPANEEDRVEVKGGSFSQYFTDALNPEFRLILTSMPCDYFPITVLQNGVKLTNEPPKGIKANMTKSLNDLPEDIFNLAHKEEQDTTAHGSAQPPQEDTKGEMFKNMVFSFCLFHAVILERRKFGPLGYNIQYDFNDSDLDTTIKTMKLMVMKYNEIPLEAIKFLTSEINYGGRVTDPWDRRTVSTILNVFTRDVNQSGSVYTASPIYFVPVVNTVPEMLEIVKGYPELDPAAIFGMSANAEIAYQLKESKKALEIVLGLQVADNSAKKEGEKSPDDVVNDFCQKLQGEGFPPLILREGETKPEIRDFKDPLDVCLVQEVERFNRLLSYIAGYVIDLEKAVKGELVMTEELEQAYNAILNNQVPKSWAKLAYPSMKNLANWYIDLQNRVTFFRSWYVEGKPATYLLAAFFFPQGFLTSVLQAYSRDKGIPIDRLNYSFEFKNPDNSSLGKPEKGCYIRGLFMEACKYDPAKNVLVDNPIGQMTANAPLIYFIPVENFIPNPKDYAMPLYKTAKRAGTLSATGQSTNFILTIYVPTGKLTSEYWILNGAAFTCDRSD
jgi:dynein heavy chain